MLNNRGRFCDRKEVEFTTTYAISAYRLPLWVRIPLEVMCTR